jgi:uncharacterized membrane protein YphA (DoxX/SURF4 family)
VGFGNPDRAPAEPPRNRESNVVNEESKSAGTGWSERACVFVAYAIQFFFGGWFFYNGLNYFVGFTPDPPGSSPLSRELIGALDHTGLFAVVKAVELVTGAALLANRFVPLAAVVAFPVTFAIAYVMIVINGGPVGTTTGLLAIAFNGIIALGRLDSVLPMLALSDRGPNAARLTALLKPSRARAAPASVNLPRTRKGLSPLVHAVSIVLGVGAPVLIELATMSYFQSVARKTMTEEEAVRALDNPANEARELQRGMPGPR